MDKRIDFTGVNPDIRLDQILIDATANRPAMFAMLKSYAVGTYPNYIVSGCVVTVGGSVPSNTWSLTAGYIYLNDELIQVVAQSGTFNSSTQYLAFSKVTTYNAKGDITYRDGITRQTWQENRGVITVKSSVLTTELDAINGDTLTVKIEDRIIGASTTLNRGTVTKATPTEAQAGTADKFIDAALLQQVTSTETRKGVVEKATNAEGKAGTTDKNITADVFQGLSASDSDVLAGTEASEWVSPAGLTAKDGGLITKVLSIGDWNMDSTGFVVVSHGISDHTKIRQVTATIRDDSNSAYYPLDRMNNLTGTSMDGAVSFWSSTGVNIMRVSGGSFDGTGFTSTSFNRGWITIKYLP